MIEKWHIWCIQIPNSLSQILTNLINKILNTNTDCIQQDKCTFNKSAFEKQISEKLFVNKRIYQTNLFEGRWAVQKAYASSKFNDWQIKSMCDMFIQLSQTTPWVKPSPLIRTRPLSSNFHFIEDLVGVRSSAENFVHEIQATSGPLQCSCGI